MTVDKVIPPVAQCKRNEPKPRTTKAENDDDPVKRNERFKNPGDRWTNAIISVKDCVTYYLMPLGIDTLGTLRFVQMNRNRD